MKKGRIIITLKSDLCVGDGSTFNSMIDTDICKDRFGFPYIPAKRLRGCLRECADELADWGEEIKADAIFGTEGNKRALVRIGNAYIEDLDQYVNEINACPGNQIFHPQNVIEQFTYVRTQTAVDNETGTADKTTLRTVRVVNRNLKFISEVSIDAGSKDETVVKGLKDCCSILRHMGIARTRGFGEVQVCYEDISESESVMGVDHKALLEGADRLDYTIELVEPMILKSVNGGEERTQDYIEGSKILGLAVQLMKEKEEDVADFLSGNSLFFSNAYISQDGVRFLEAPATYYEVKNHDNEFRNKLYDNKENRDKYDKGFQVTQMKHCYVSPESQCEIKRANVVIEERYHHRRPKDKSIGRASSKEDDNSNLYQISSISSGQTFAGFVSGTKEEVKRVYDALSKQDLVFLGYGRSSEYGLAKIRIIGSKKQTDTSSFKCKDFAVKLEAPTIVYNENACTSINCDDLISEIKAAMGIDGDYSVKNAFLKYVTVGGYNVTWNRRKPTVEAFGAGTVVVFHSDEPLNITVPPVLKLGERCREGFGEATLFEVDPSENGYFGTVVTNGDVDANETKLDLIKNPFAGKIAFSIFEKYIRTEAAGDAGKFFRENKIDNCKPVISNLALMVKELLEKKEISGSYNQLMSIVDDRFDKNSERKRGKHENAKEIIDHVCKNCDGLIERMTKDYQLVNLRYGEDLLFLRYLEAFLMHGKYMLHSIEERRMYAGKETKDE